MGRNKRRQIEEVKSFANVDSAWAEGSHKKRPGEWGEDVVLEIGCGWGQYTLALARKHPERNFVGVDRKGDRIWMGAREALEEGLENVRFLQVNVVDLGEWFAEEEVSEIWVTFPDPQPKPSKANQRLISHKTLEVYRSICKKGATVHLKTDNLAFFEQALEVVGECEEVIWDVHGMVEVPEKLQILTYYEQKFMAEGVPIKYLRFSLN